MYHFYFYLMLEYIYLQKIYLHTIEKSGLTFK